MCLVELCENNSAALRDQFFEDLAASKVRVEDND